ncbi:hypothetical protein [Streptomyces sp. NPDC001404]|uniref:hypothetical protein n=1 Tax=Streptomyces sp. NPDC001404 TaxID=3364571 RepID=UPI0036C0C218
MIPTPDVSGELWTGDKVDLAKPPCHCGVPMRVRQEYGGGFRLDCLNDDYEMHTDMYGVLSEPPYMTAE